MLRTAFDNYAGRYDADFTNSATGMAQRKKVWQRLQHYLRRSDSVLEINCGTGVDALYMAGLAANVDACDLSGEMIRVCREKTQGKTEGQVNFFVQDIRNIAQLSKKYDWIVSNFAGLNCLDETELRKFAGDSKDLLEKDGRLFLVFFGQKCAWENFYFFVKGDPRRGRRKTMNGAPTEIEGQDFRTYYYSKKMLGNIFSGYDILEARPIGLFLPPGFMEKWFRQRPSLIRLLAFLERLFAWMPFTADYGDHLLLVLKKN